MKINGKIWNILSNIYSYLLFIYLFIFLISIYRLACQSEDKDYLTKEEFVSFCLSNKDISKQLMSDRKKKIKYR
jgi:hypothetical protein